MPFANLSLINWRLHQALIRLLTTDKHKPMEPTPTVIVDLSGSNSLGIFCLCTTDRETRFFECCNLLFITQVYFLPPPFQWAMNFVFATCGKLVVGGQYGVVESSELTHRWWCEGRIINLAGIRPLWIRNEERRGNEIFIKLGSDVICLDHPMIHVDLIWIGREENPRESYSFLVIDYKLDGVEGNL